MKALTPEQFADVFELEPRFADHYPRLRLLWAIAEDHARLAVECARLKAEYEPEYDGPREIGDTTGDKTDAAHRQEQARRLK